MATSILVDAGFLVALLSRRDSNHRWAEETATRHPPLWTTCEAVLSEAFDLLGEQGGHLLAALLTRGALSCVSPCSDDIRGVLHLKEKFAAVPMSLADACLVRMTELATDVVVLTTDSVFHIYRRHNRKVVPCIVPF
jgi:predicted nucleic acid-binding protein